MADQFLLQPVGYLACPVRVLDRLPKNYTDSDIRGTITILPAFAAALDGIAAGDRIVVLFWLHRARRDLLRVHPRGDRNRPLRGVFATRSPARPNPIGLSELLVEAVDGLSLSVRGVDVLDGTPVIDIKKKVGQKQRPAGRGGEQRA